MLSHMQEKNIKMHCCFYCGGLFFRSIVMIRVSELGTGAGSSSAPLQLHSELLRSCNFFFIEERAGLSRQKWSAPLQLRSSGAFHFFFKFRYCRIHMHWFQPVDKMLSQRDISHHIFTGDPLSSC